MFYNCRSCVPDRIARAVNRSGASQTAALDISNIIDRIWNAGLLQT